LNAGGEGTPVIGSINRVWQNAKTSGGAGPMAEYSAGLQKDPMSREQTRD
jgi:hypothetical protein